METIGKCPRCGLEYRFHWEEKKKENEIDQAKKSLKGKGQTVDEVLEQQYQEEVNPRP